MKRMLDQMESLKRLLLLVFFVLSAMQSNTALLGLRTVRIMHNDSVSSVIEEEQWWKGRREWETVK
jgi:hypothetical protein